MPVIPSTPANGRSFILKVQGVNLTGIVPATSVKITETAGESNAQMTFTIHYPTGASTTWLTSLSHHVELRDTVDNRPLFTGNLVRALRRHAQGPGIYIDCTCISYDAWLDRRILPKWVSKENVGGVVRKISSDRKIVQAIMARTEAVPWVDAINTYVLETNTDMPVLDLPDGSVRSHLAAVAEAAATSADPTARHFYVDFSQHLHYFKGAESSAAPYRIGDAEYTRVVKATSGLVSLWPLREVGSTTAYDTKGYAHASLNGGYQQGIAPLVANEPGMRSLAFTSGTAYASASGANLHPGNTFSIELWFRRFQSGLIQAMWSGGTDDVEIGFTAADEIYVAKEGTGNNFVTNATWTDTNPHHLVVTREPGTTVVYVDGVSKAGTVTARTFVAGSGTINMGRRKSGTDRYYFGKLQNVALYNNTLSAATVLAHYNDGITIVPDYIDFETDVNSAGKSVYVKGGNAAGTGWVTPTPLNAAYSQTLSIDRPQSTTAALKTAIGTAFLKRDANELYGGRIVLTGFNGWRAGQTVVVDDAALGINGSYEIKQLDTNPNLGSGQITYELSYGVMPWSGSFDVQRKRRK